jgi:hypothetical protein
MAFGVNLGCDQVLSGFESPLVEVQNITFLIPNDYEGPVLIIFGQETGAHPEMEGDHYLFRIPRHGVLRTQVKASHQFHERRFAYINAHDERMLIPYLYPAGGAWRDKEHTFDNVDFKSNQIFVMADIMGNTMIDGSLVYFQTFVVGKARDADVLTLKGYEQQRQAFSR